MSNTLIRILFLFLFPLFIAYLSFTGQLQNYIASRQLVYVELATVLMFLLALVNLYLWWNKEEIEACDDCDHVKPERKWTKTLLYGLFALPIVLGLTVSDEIDASNLAQVKGIQLQNNQLSNLKITTKKMDVATTDLDKVFQLGGFAEGYAGLGKRLYLKEKIVVTKKGFSEILSTLSTFKQYYVGKPIEISGFVYKDAGMNSQQFMLSRLLISCCSADVLPYGIVIQTPEADRYFRNSWLKISGTIALVEYNGQEVVAILPSKIQKIQKPKSLYIPSFKGKLEELPYK